MRVVISFLGAISIFLSAQMIYAQSSRANPRDVVVESNRQELDNLLLRKPILTAEDKSAQRAVLKQINEDFKALQVVNNRLMTEATSPGVNYNSLAKLLSELENKASRLKSNLLLPTVELKKQKELAGPLDATRFNDSLHALDTVVMSFATNPIFQRMNVVELEQAKRASRDLATIIRQSSRLKKAAARLSK